ncbi:MAG TPA: aminotransferase class III-fold pyridoxal phosphate-dependent enzyme [Polyangiaceae bacterium]|nr:aminotransferase class III-fold pyridoxal phosphate-dependent enzyme [Polyangiaceae bacterium]
MIAQQNGTAPRATHGISRTDIADVLRAEVAALLRLSKGDVDTAVPLLELGADSLVIVEIVQKFRDRFQVQLTVRQLFEEFVTIDALAEYVGGHTPSLSEETVAAPVALHAARHVTDGLVQHLSSLLRLSPSDVQHDMPLLEMGADSLVIVEMIRRVEQQFGVVLTVRQLFEEFVTVSALSDYLVAQLAATDDRRALPSEIRLAPAPEAPVTGTSSAHAISKISQSSPLGGGAQTSAQIQRLQTLVHRAQTLLGAELRTDASRARAAWRRTGASTCPPAVDAIVQRYLAQTASSHDTMKSVAGGDTSRSSVEAALAAPVRFTDAVGPRLFDVDGNEYVDLWMGGGCHLFGHRPGFLTEALDRQLTAGIQLGPVGQDAGVIAEKLCAMMGTERVTFANSYAEGVMTALRLCRAATNRRRVVALAASMPLRWDEIESGRARQSDDGTDLIVVRDLLEALNVVSQNADVAAVLVDGAVVDSAQLAPLSALRAQAAATHACFVVDERATLFRLDFGGINRALDLNADLLIHAGALSDGLPCSILAGREAVLDHVDGGWAGVTGGESRGVATTYTAGTYCRNPLSMAAARAVVLEVEKCGRALTETLCQRADELVGEVNHALQKRSVPVEARGHGARFELRSLDPHFDVRWLMLGLRTRGVYVEPGILSLSTAHAEVELNVVVDAVEAVAEELSDTALAASAELSLRSGPRLAGERGRPCNK